MNRLRWAGRLFAFCAVTLLIVVLAPAVLLGGELVNRHYHSGLRTGRPRRHRFLRGARRHHLPLAGGLDYPGRPGPPPVELTWRRERLGVAHLLISNPVWIMLTAPARWLIDRIRPRAGGRRGRGGNGAGVREPRRPLPDLPAGAMALPEPGPFG